jgi:hypothetical protein
MAQRSLYVIIKVYYMSSSCFAMIFPVYSAKVSPDFGPLLHIVDQITFCVLPHITEQDSQPIAILISK